MLFYLILQEKKEWEGIIGGTNGHGIQDEGLIYSYTRISYC